ncbi:MAG: glycoside hydrolase family 88 protein [Candidatus Hydrogenedentes bacterium]|nr:glycoside hydrolase family 88 protein [Candidatus Hydrogenedentota bacterium]
MQIDDALTLAAIQPRLEAFFALAGPKIRALEDSWDPKQGSPVFTAAGRYTARGWTEWTQGFQYGCQILHFDATGDEAFLEMGRRNTLLRMAPHVSHVGVHDHGFNNLSTYGNLWRLEKEGRIPARDGEAYHALAIKLSGAIQAARWSGIADGSGFIHSFNGPHSLFSDTIRSCRILMLAHLLGHVLMGEGDRSISLFERAAQHMINTAKYNVYYGEGRDSYDVPGRVVHESIFNMKDGNYRCPSTQQGYTPFSTWTRGLAWVLLGAAEELELLRSLPAGYPCGNVDRNALSEALLRMATETAEFYLENTARDGIPFWDTGAPGLAHLPNYTEEDAQPDNPYEPLDSSAAVIAAQGLLRLGCLCGLDTPDGQAYWQAGLTVANTLFQAPFLSEAPDHQGLLLHSVYHRPNGWDYIPPGKCVPHGESSMWGDYHAMELAVYLKRLHEGGPYLTFFGKLESI